jgi:O-succinylbenzoic acid--CoA ligase
VEPWLERAAALRPDEIAVEAADGALTYAELLARARELRITAPRVALALPPSLDLVVALHACWLAGVEAVPVDLREPVWRTAGAGQVIEALENGRPRAGAGPALVVHTSGTTGSPRPVVLSAANVLANALGCLAALGRPDRWLSTLPLSHIGGLMVLFRSVIACSTAVLVDRTDVSHASLVPTQLARRIDEPLDALVMLGGAPADPSLLVRAREAGWRVAPTYGLTQACSAVTVAEPGDTETSGRALPGLSVTLADDGEIIVAGPSVVGGVHATGDLGELDARGRLIVRGRKVDTIVSGGENVMPQEVEAALLSHPAVREAGVFGRPDPDWGEAVTALVVGDIDPTELREHAQRKLARFKVPKTIEVVGSLPRNASGKLLRRELT